MLHNVLQHHLLQLPQPLHNNRMKLIPLILTAADWINFKTTDLDTTLYYARLYLFGTHNSLVNQHWLSANNNNKCNHVLVNNT